ncbi:ribose 5-phosphate isomerase B [Micavibrio aeruginosavorus]|uniref:ribose 5-phosphate isomerase B n=1 Tax=Micavibrio aeruginosavorus TaxID=349221 RepID=UPI003F4ABC8E
MPNRQTLAISCDHAGFAMKEALKSHFADRVDWIDLGTNSVDSVSYADFGKAMGQAITDGRAERGIVICGSGNGIAIAANRFPAVRCGLCTDATMARLTRQHNDANVMALGARIIGIQVAIDCVEEFLNTAFEGGRHQARVDALGQC